MIVLLGQSSQSSKAVFLELTILAGLELTTCPNPLVFALIQRSLLSRPYLRSKLSNSAMIECRRYGHLGPTTYDTLAEQS